ncbi:MAG: hypothetical protein J7J98_04585 [candidate division Zixibacteria bacterium]|nr:hypothetical protein [candidate division Zixibacteria bacterium]
MKWFRNLMGEGSEETQRILGVIQGKFSNFLKLLDHDNRIHAIIGEMEEKARAESDFDMVWVRAKVGELRHEIARLTDATIRLGGESYEPLTKKLREIFGEIDLLLPRRRVRKNEPLTITLDRLGRDGSSLVGSKCVQLGQIRVRLGLPVPDGFAVSGSGYHQFLEANHLRDRIHQRIETVDITRYDDLVKASQEIRAVIAQAKMPAELDSAIREAAANLARRSDTRVFSVRSSAIGEDAYFSFAGQYATYLNVRLEDIVDRYRDVIASKFSPQALYYYLSLPQMESELPMSVGCVTMINARSSGVIYTRCPVKPHDEMMIINSIFGLGELVVDGTLTPDSFRVSRRSGHIIDTVIAHKPVRLENDSNGGTMRVEIEESQRDQPSIDKATIDKLVDYALKIERLYHCPQDIEWAMDESGEIYILQARSLKVIEPVPSVGLHLKDLIPLLRGGVTVCSGAGAGPVYHARSVSDLPDVPEGAVLVAPHTFPGLVTVMQKVSAIVTETGGVANHMATIAREYGVPTLSSVPRALASLSVGQEVTVDATKAMIYDGIQQQLIDARRPDAGTSDSLVAVCTLRGLLKKISPLNLVHPNGVNFEIDSCRTLHDLTRFCHQRAMEEMFYGGLSVPEKERVSVRLQSEIPLNVHIIYVDQEITDTLRKTGVDENNIDSEPMRHFWQGVRHEGWPTARLPKSLERFSVFGSPLYRDEDEGYSESSFAILSQEYMIVGLRMGYHFTTVEGMCTSYPQKNYIRMQYKEGGATPERRERRIKLIKNVLSRLGFEHQAKGDFLDTHLMYSDKRQICEGLSKLGRLIMLTKQLDMALTTDKVTDWYTRDIRSKLGID